MQPRWSTPRRRPGLSGQAHTLHLFLRSFRCLARLDQNRSGSAVSALRGRAPILRPSTAVSLIQSLKPSVASRWMVLVLMSIGGAVCLSYSVPRSVSSLSVFLSLSLSLSLSLYLVSQAIQSGSVRFSWPAHLARPALYTCIPSAGESRDAIRRRSEGL